MGSALDVEIWSGSERRDVVQLSLIIGFDRLCELLARLGLRTRLQLRQAK